jgi:outer membrane protein assembly factor BamB
MTGKPRWSYDITKDGFQTSFHGDPLAIGDLILIGSDFGERAGAIGHVYAFEQGTGKVRWKYLVEGGMASDIVRSGSNVLAITMDYQLLCLDLASGKLRWRFKPEEKSDKLPWHPLAMAGGRVFFGGQQGVVYALQPESGRMLWKKSLGSRVTTGFLPVGKDLYLGTVNGKLHRLSQLSGTVTAESDSTEILVKQPTSFGDSLLYFYGQNTLTCTDRSFKIRWKHTLESAVSASRPYIWRDAVLAGTSGGELMAFAATDGRPRWHRKFGGLVRGIWNTDRTFYIGILSGAIHAFARPQDGS